MKICWDNLEGLRYSKKTGKWYRGRDTTFEYRDKCFHCGEPFLGEKNSKYCTKECLYKDSNAHIITEEHRKKISDTLKNIKHTDEHNKKVSKGLLKYYKTHNGPWVGRKHTEETKQKIGKWHKGKILSEETKKKLSDSHSGEKHINYGKHLSEETKKKISKSNKGHEGLKGKNNPLWKGGYNSNNIPLYDTYAERLKWVESVRRNGSDPNILEVKCTHCDKWFIPNLVNVRNRIYSLNGRKGYKGENRFYCSEGCKKACFLYGKTPEQLMKEDAVRAGRLPWTEINREVQTQLRQMVLERDEYTCVRCGSTEKLHCHHIDPVATNPLESADVDNCITLCEECHKKVHQQPGCRYGELKECYE